MAGGDEDLGEEGGRRRRWEAMKIWKKEVHERRLRAADVLFSYSKFVAACILNRVRPCDLRMHLMKMHGEKLHDIWQDILEMLRAKDLITLGMKSRHHHSLGVLKSRY